MYLEPVFNTSYTNSTAKDAKIKENLEKTYSKAQRVEYCLEKGIMYYLMVTSENFDFGPPDNQGTRPSRDVYFVHISDKPFKNGKPQRPLALTYQAAIYG